MTVQTYIVQIKANENTLRFFKNMLGQQARAYNHCADIIRDQHVPLSLKTIHEAVYTTLRATYPELPAQTIIKTYKSVLSAYRTIRANKHKANTPRQKKLSTVIDKRLYANLDVNGIDLTGETPHKRTRYEFMMYGKMRAMFDQYKTKDPTLFIRNDRLYLSVPFEIPEKPVMNDNACGVDLGIKRLFVTSEGKAFKDKSYLRARRNIRYLKSRLQKKGTKSARRHLRALKRREANISKDVQYRAVKQLLGSTSADVIVLEDLSKIKTTTSKNANGHKRKRHNNMMSQVPFYGFRIKLSAKAPLYGKKVETVNPSFTSQKDSRSGKKDGTRNGCRYYCKDGLVLDADWNAAVNIAKKGKHPVSNVLPVDGGVMFLTGRAQSTAPSYVNPMRCSA